MTTATEGLRIVEAVGLLEAGKAMNRLDMVCVCGACGDPQTLRVRMSSIEKRWYNGMQM
jgi:hypothetical protein